MSAQLREASPANRHLQPMTAAQQRADARPSAVAMLPLARALWDRGGAVDAALALPLYVRDKVAQTTAEREAARATPPSAKTKEIGRASCRERV